MQLSKLMMAVAAFATGSAMAATPAAQIAISSGASASKNNLKLALAAKCASPAVLTEYTDGTSNVSTYVCASSSTYATSTPTNFTGTAFAELRLNVNGGSFTAVCLLAGWPTGTQCPVADQYWDPSAGAMAAAPSGSVAVGGFMDVEPAGFLASIRSGIANPPSVVTAGFYQVFGVAASSDLYSAMFADQQGSGKLPNTCTSTSYAQPECVPVIGKAQMATIMNANLANAAYSKGAQFLAPTQFAAPTPLTYLRRVDTSGTQASAQQYFLGNVCNSNGLPVVAAGASSGQITVTALPTTGGVRTALNNPGYAIGIMSGENNQTSQTWKWLRVGGMSMSESALPADASVASITNTATALDGRYDYFFLSRIAQPAATGAAATFWTAVKGGYPTLLASATKGLFQTGETLFTKGSANACVPVSSN